MSEDGEKDKEKGSKRPSRPVTAAARRERRASARPSGKGAEASSGDAADVSKRPAPKGKTSGNVPPPTGGKGRPTPRRDRDDAKQSLFARLVRFIREVLGELRKVIWPTRKQMTTYTIVVLIFVAFMVALVAGLDFVFLEGMDVVFGN
ncbi:preprotein translocase subunit SecE [Qaidamihabitans albus]|uniref:preprotein translocase subunit SecE n=1 Tax=Qaidamihabitans albus TaxID=2795733 RepID=UPI0018F17C73|nr:preprotein translocase subunit SecE [Qaidamihabitans albus]